MNLSISNIAWTAEQEAAIYKLMKEFDFTGLEIAPTRIFPEDPYSHIKKAKDWAQDLKNKYGFRVSSMQSIWYGRQEKVFGTKEERNLLIQYTKQAINFAEAIGCHNLVFGCPKNRIIPDGMSTDSAKSIAVVFFRHLGEYAIEHHTVIGMEANPPIYNTNFINGTSDALSLIREVNSDGFKLNLDVGTMIQKEENVSILDGNIYLVNHVHISEPYLKPIQERKIHKELLKLLQSEGYKKFISIEMGSTKDIKNIKSAVKYLYSFLNQ